MNPNFEFSALPGESRQWKRIEVFTRSSGRFVPELGVNVGKGRTRKDPQCRMGVGNQENPGQPASAWFLGFHGDGETERREDTESIQLRRQHFGNWLGVFMQLKVETVS